MTLYLGIDIGTSGVRTCAIDANARLQAQVTVPLPEPVQHQARIEQEPGLWWTALAASLDEIAAEIPMASVEAIALDGTSSTLLCCNQDGTPLMPALMYNDARAIEQAQQIATIAPGKCAAHGASSSLAKLLYLQSTGALDNARYVLHQADWLLGRLANRYGSSDENNALKLGYDPINRCWPDWLDQLGIPRALLPEVAPPGRTVGVIDAQLAARWGLPTWTRIVSGTTDSTAGFLATGAGPGEAVTSLGSTLVLKVYSKRPVFAPDYGIYSHRLNDHWLVGGASNTGGAVLRQFFTQQEIDRLSVSLHPDTPTGLDYYPLPAPGERFPENNPHLQPCLEPRPEQDAEFFQGILEGIAAIEHRGYLLLEALGVPYPKRIQTVGGGAANAAWRRIRETVLGVPVVAAEHQGAAYGAALLALRSQAHEDTGADTGGMGTSRA